MSSTGICTGDAMRIGPIDLTKRVCIVAEIGNNHEGNVDLAVRMIRLAAEAGVDAVKFQTIVPERLVSHSQPERLARLRHFALSREDFTALKQVADAEGVLFLSTPFDPESARFLELLVPAFKIASGDNDFYPLLDLVAATGKPVLLSTGLAGLNEVKAAVSRIGRALGRQATAEDVAVLHCVAGYPVPAAEANLRGITALGALNLTVGYSDHTVGIEAAVLSVALGARIVEKHFTVDKAYSDFRDHQLAADPDDMAALVARVRQAEAMLGPGGKRLMDCEAACVLEARRSARAGRDIPAGTVLAAEDINWLRPGGDIGPSSVDEVAGRRLRRRLNRGEAIRLADLA